MSQSTNTITNTTNSSESTMFSTEHKATITPSKSGIKRTVSDETEHQTKKIMVEKCSPYQHTENTSKSSIEIKFISAAQVAGTSNSNTDTIPEITDEELLEMALMFEKNQQQQ